MDAHDPGVDPGGTESGGPGALAEALVSAQRWDAALRELGPALAQSPDDPRLLGLLVRTLRGLGRREDAVEAARRMLTVAPHDPYGYRLATLVLLDVGWVDEAIGVATRAVTLDPNNAANHLALSRAWAGSPRPGAVGHQLAAAREAVLLEPNSVDAQVQIGAALAADADIEGARAAYHAALRLDPGNSAALNNLAVLDLQSGDAGAAARGLAAALAADPQGVTARRNLDAVALRVLRRVGWWLLLSPLPALVAARLDRPGVARLLAVLALLALPLVVLRFWRALSVGQRAALRRLPRRVRAVSWVWPAVTLVAGGWALLRVLVAAESVSSLEVAVYVSLVLYLSVIRLLSAVFRPSGRAEATARWSHVRSRMRPR